ncbi:hypothetical protein [Bacteroides ihuae]|uniref:hypothetical protein n=1 Tax=Bacteroides ihuae TaxID=1852362 RepID=UPI0008D988B1|nr:hypothetical protein [Bacteroides ihuae]
MSNISDIMSVNVNNLRERQYSALKSHVLEKLNRVSKAIEEDRLSDIESELSFSPAGDGYGCNNHFIDFNWEKGDETIDMAEVTNMLMELSGHELKMIGVL